MGAPCPVTPPVMDLTDPVVDFTSLGTPPLPPPLLPVTEFADERVMDPP